MSSTRTTALAGLLVAALTALALRWLVPPRISSLHGLTLWISAYTVAVAWAGAAAAGAVSALRRVDRELTISSVLRTVTAALWFAPLAIFPRGLSVWSYAASAFCAAALTVFFAENRPLPFAPIAAALATSLALQCSVLAIAIGHWQWGRSLIVIAACLFTWSRLSQSGSAAPTLRRLAWNWLGVWLFLAATLVPLISSRFVRSGGGGEDPRGRDSTEAQPAEGYPGATGGTYTGVILLTPEEPHTVLVPPLPALRNNPFRQDPKDPLNIPFWGVYWYFRRPDRKPPPTSYIIRGDAARLSFRSWGVPLTMEAHQNLGVPFNTNCCRAIELAVRNGDSYTGTVAVELILTDTFLPKPVSESLGMQGLESEAPVGSDGKRIPVPEILTFHMPLEASALKQFDEFTVRFLLSMRRADHSARVGIDRFTPVPR